MRGTACNTLRWLVVLATSSGVSCRGIGPPTIARDRIDYASGGSGRQQTLLLGRARRAVRRDRQRRRERRLPANQ